MSFGLREGFQVGAGRWGAVVAALVGVSAVNVPAAHAVDTGIAVTGLVINEGKPVVIGTQKSGEPSLRFDVHLLPGAKTLREYSERPFLYRGNDPKKAFSGDQGKAMIRSTTICYEEGARKERCEGAFYFEVNAKWGEIRSNADAGTWKVGLEILVSKGGKIDDKYERRALTVSLRRAAKATVAATPGTVVKGKKVTVTGKLTRANWDTRKIDAYGGRAVNLEYRASDATSFKTLKKVTTSRTGALTATVNATASGFYRWVYAGDTVTSAVTGPAAYVDVH